MGKPKKEFFTMEDRTGSIFLKFYDEQIIEYFGTDDEKAEIEKHAAKILQVNQDMLDIRKKINILTKRLNKEIDDAKSKDIKKNIEDLGKSLEPLIEDRQKANDACTAYSDTVVKSKGYYDRLCAAIRAIPCVPNDGTYNTNDCYYILMIKHDKDVLKDDIWTPTPEKAHYHLCARTAPVPGQRVRQIRIRNWLEDIVHIKYRQGVDDTLMKNQGVDVCRSFNDCVLYLLHATEASRNDGKFPYSVAELVHNMNHEYVQQLMQGMKRLDGSMEKLTLAAWEKLEDEARAWGLSGGKWKDFLSDKSFETRSRFKGNNEKAVTVRDAYNDAMEEYLEMNRKDFVRNAIFIEGDPFMGKTATSRLALEALGYNHKDIFDVGKGSAKFDKYNDERCLICEDRGMEDIRRVCESNYCRLRKRNRGEGLWYGDTVIITSNKEFKVFCVIYTLGSKERYENLSSSDKCEVDATMSRFSVFKCDKEGYINLIQVSNREDGVKRIQQARFVYKFQKEYNKSRKKYLDTLIIHVDDDYLMNINFEDDDYFPAELDYLSSVQYEKSVMEYENQFIPDIPDDMLYDGKLHIGFERIRDEKDLPFHDDTILQVGGTYSRMSLELGYQEYRSNQIKQGVKADLIPNFSDWLIKHNFHMV